MEEHEITNKNIYDLLQNVLKKTDKIETTSDRNTDDLKQEIRNLKTEIKQELEGLRRENEEIKRENQNLKTRILTTERKLKKYNLVLYGIKEEENIVDETDCILNIINEKLEINCQSFDIRDHYRIG